jgi:DNA polymerase III subunit beta
MTLKASCMTDAFVREVTAVAKSKSNRSALPILGNILIEATDAGLYLTATNLETRLRAFVPGKVEEAGSTTVDIATLQHLIAQFDKTSKTALLLDGNRLFVGDTKGTTGRLPTIDPQEMPTMPDFEQWPIVALIEPDVLKERLETAIPFMPVKLA